MEAQQAYESVKALLGDAVSTDEVSSSLKCLMNVLGFDGAYFLSEALRQREGLLEINAIASPDTPFYLDYVGAGRAVGMAPYSTFSPVNKLVKFGVLELVWENEKGATGKKKHPKYMINDGKLHKMILAVKGS